MPQSLQLTLLLLASSLVNELKFVLIVGGREFVGFHISVNNMIERHILLAKALLTNVATLKYLLLKVDGEAFNITDGRGIASGTFLVSYKRLLARNLLRIKIKKIYLLSTRLALAIAIVFE